MTSRPEAGRMALTRSTILTIAIIVVLMLVAGCTTSPDAPDEVVGTSVRISGSGTCLPLIQLLTSAYPDSSVEFVYLPGLHSGGGIDGVHQGDLDLGAISRGLEGEETGFGLDVTVLSTDALAVAVHPSAGIDALTTEQVRDIYAGRVNTWAELGGSAVPVVVLDRPEDESAKKVLREYVLGDSFVVAEEAVEMSYESDMVEGVESSPGSIGFFSLGVGMTSGANVVYVALDGVEPSVATVADQTYAMTRQLGVVSDPGAPSAISDFLAWAGSPEARSLIAADGFAAPLDL